MAGNSDIGNLDCGVLVPDDRSLNIPMALTVKKLNRLQ